MQPFRSGAIVLRKVAGRFEAVRYGMTLARGTRATTLGTFHPFATVMHFAAVLMPILLILVAIAALFHPSHASPMASLVIGFAGSTTGTKSSGTDFTGLNDAMKYVYAPSMDTNIEGESEVINQFEASGDFERIEGSDGKGIQVPMVISSGGGVSFQLEDDYVISSTPAKTVQGTATLKQITARAEMSGRAMRRVIEGPAALATWAERILPDRAARVAFHMDRAYVGAGTGIIARINGTPDGTGDGVDTAFGIAGLEGALNLFEIADILRYGPNADGSSLRTNAAVVADINYNAATFDTTVSGSAGTPASAADNDFVFLGDANVNSSGAREIMGLEGHIDDGTNVTTYQALTRSTYKSVLYGQIIDSTTYANNPTVLSENIIDYSAAQAWERAKGRTDMVLCNRNGQRSFWNAIKGDRTINDPQGQYTGGKKDTGLLMYIGNDIVSLRSARKVPSSRCYGLDRSTFRRCSNGPGQWVDITGAVWRPVQDSTGVKDAYYAMYVREEELVNYMPARNWKITGLAAA
jgi:hypothetical protein